MHNDTTSWVRCPNCISLDLDEFVDGSVRCDNCGMDLKQLMDLSAPDPRRTCPFIRYWCCRGHRARPAGRSLVSKAVRRTTTATNAGIPLLAIKRRACADGFPVAASPGSATDASGPHRFAVGERGVCTDTQGIRLVGGGPFALLEVIDIHPNGDLDVARTDDGTIWMGVPQRAILHLA